MPGDEGGGRWSRSGDRIAVTRVLADDRIGTAILAPDGTVERLLDIPDDSLNLACTVWSPDDKRLACEGWDEQEPSRSGIYTVRSSDGGGMVRLTKTPHNLVDFVGDYSPDGTMFLFKRTTDEDPGPLMVVPSAGGDTTRLSDLDVEDPGRYSPDGKTILTSAGGHVVLLDASGQEISRDDQDGTYLFGPVWSPDGDYIAYSGTSSGFHADIYTSRPDGSDRHQVTSTPDNEIRVEWGRD
jgi:TolB protein